MLHALEITDKRVELFALEEVWKCNVISTLSKTNHLGSDANTTLVQDFDSILVTLANLAQDVLLWHLHVVKVEDAGRGSSDTKLG